jgi:hypothetical protein
VEIVRQRDGDKANYVKIFANGPIWARWKMHIACQLTARVCIQSALSGEFFTTQPKVLAAGVADTHAGQTADNYVFSFGLLSALMSEIDGIDCSNCGEERSFLIDL